MIEKYKALYPNYFCGNYVYSSRGDWLIVLQKLIDTKTNENRINIFDPNYAEYLADKLKIIFIVSKYFPTENVLEIVLFDCHELINLKVNNIIYKSENFRLCFYNNIEPAYYQDIVNENYTNIYKSWYDNGLLSSEGNYKNGKKTIL